MEQENDTQKTETPKKTKNALDAVMNADTEALRLELESQKALIEEMKKSQADFFGKFSINKEKPTSESWDSFLYKFEETENE
jgi:hypothetical protein